MKRILFAAVLTLTLAGCTLRPSKIEGEWVFHSVNDVDIAQYAAVKGRTTEDVAHSLVISGKNAVLEDISGERELKLSMTKEGFTFIDEDREKCFYYESEKDILVYINGEETWVYSRN